MMPFKFSKKVLIFLFLSVGLLLGGVYLYLKKKADLVVPELVTTEKESSSLNTNFFFDLERTDGLIGTDNIKQGIAHSGTMSCDLSGGKEYGFSVIKKLSDAGKFPLKRVSASVWIYPLTENSNVVLTASISNSKGESIFWDGKSTEKMSLPIGKWTKINAAYNLPVEKLTSEDVLQINIWNKGKTDVIVDDLEVVYGESNERRGVYSGVDANAFYEKRFVSQRNKAPFPIVYFEKQEINNENTTQLVPGNSDSDLSPNDEYLSGDFLVDKNNLDELLCIRNDKLLLFGYDPAKKMFELRMVLTDVSKQWQKETKKYAGDFNADGRADVLLIDTVQKNWKLIELKNKSWISVSSGSLTAELLTYFKAGTHAFVSNLFSSGNGSAIVMPDRNGFKAFQLNVTLNSFGEVRISMNASDSILFAGSPVFYSANFAANGKSQLLRYDTEWRFDLKLLEAVSDGCVIVGTIDFKGYDNDHNPKYYEFLKMVPGRFIDSDKTSLLTILKNCADQDFNGLSCKEFENVSYLPNGIQLYSFGK